MSFFPGYKLEDYLKWNWRVTVEDQDDVRVDALYAPKDQPTIRHLNAVAFSYLVKMFESYREQVESRLKEFASANTTWNAFGSNAFDFFPDYLVDRASRFVELAVGQTVPEKRLFDAVLRAMESNSPFIVFDPLGGTIKYTHKGLLE